jgi:hypothetical protein
MKMRRESEIRERQAESGDEGKERKRRTDKQTDRQRERKRVETEIKRKKERKLGEKAGNRRLKGTDRQIDGQTEMVEGVKRERGERQTDKPMERKRGREESQGG